MTLLVHLAPEPAGAAVSVHDLDGAPPMAVAVIWKLI
jgi:hypothetical protein